MIADNSENYVVLTFHPGDPSPQMKPIFLAPLLDMYPDGHATVADAKSAGFKFVKKQRRQLEKT